jgi:hypothetical protein
MCHADLTPATFEPEPDYDGALITNFAIKSQCRDFGKIHEWAKIRNREVPFSGNVRFGQ